MIPAEWAKKMALKAIPVLSEQLLKESEKNELLEGETDYCYLVISRRDKETQKPKLLVFNGAGNFTQKPYQISRILSATNVEDKIQSIDFEEYKNELKAAIKNGTLEAGLKTIDK